ncbi:hypothetical protein PLICRDRAFT_40987 [Plicaturopsis crispa FD-325 SS-3]|nr:hypothetical protein PLICRDRAFT_40987 [Plicaturopsis crispa FD-325 SS-3]
MKFTSPAAALSLAFLPAFAFAAQVSWDSVYDNKSASLDTVICSGSLEPKYTTYGSLPSFPYIGGASAITEYDSPSCGTCWNLTYSGAGGNTTSIKVLAIDEADDGFNLSLEAMNALTNGKGGDLGIVQANATQVDKSVCGL